MGQLYWKYYFGNLKLRNQLYYKFQIINRVSRIFLYKIMTSFCKPMAWNVRENSANRLSSLSEERSIKKLEATCGETIICVIHS